MAGNGERGGRGGMPQFQGVGVGGFDRAVAVGGDSLLGAGLAQVGKGLHEFALGQLPQAKARQEAAGRAEGLAAAQEGRAPVQRADEGTILGAEFNAGLAATYAAQVGLDVRDTLTRLGRENEDPAAFEKAADGYAAGLLNSVPAGLRPAIELEVANRRGMVRAAVHEGWSVRQKQGQSATLFESLDKLGTDYRDALRRGDDQSAQFLAAESDTLLSAMVDAGHLSGQSAANARAGLQADGQLQAALGAWEKGGRGLGFINAFAANRPEGMDPEVHDKITARLRGEWTTRKAQAEAGMAGLRREVGTALDLLDAGLQVEGLDKLKARAAGTELGDALARAESDGDYVKAFVRLPGDQRAATLTALRDMPHDTQGRSAAMLDRLTKADAAASKALATDPLAYAAGVGAVAIEPVDMNQMFSDPAYAANVVRSRTEAADQIAAQYGARALPFTKPEIGVLGQVVTEGDATTQAAVLAGLSALPDGQFTAVMDAMKTDDPSFVAAAGLSRDDPRAAQAVLSGRVARKAVPGAVPSASNYAPVLDGLLGTAYAASPSTVEQVRVAALDVYADLSVRAGDTSGAFVEDRLKLAVDTVTGGLIKWRGATIAPPVRGMSEDEFSELLGRVPDAALAGSVTASGQPLTAAGLRNHARLVPVGPGQYQVRLSSGAVAAETGQLLVIDLRPYVQGAQ